MKFYFNTVALGKVFILGVLITLWVGTSAIIIVSKGDVEVFIYEYFRHKYKRDALYDLSRVVIFFWVIHSCLTATAVAAVRSRRSDVLVVLLIGPAIGLAISLFCQQWADPNWTVFVGVCLIGWLVGTVVGCLYWLINASAASPSKQLNR